MTAAGAWLALGMAATNLDRAARPANLASDLIDSGKLDASEPLRWQGRLRSDPLQLPWGLRYEINLEAAGTASGAMPVAGGLRLTYYRPDSAHTDPPAVRAGDPVEVLARALPVRNFADPGAFDYRGYLARQGIQLQGSLRSGQLLVLIGRPHLTIAERFARLRGRLFSSLNDLFASRPEEAALARAMLLGDRSFVEHDRAVDFQKTGVYHVLVLAGLHVGALAAFFLWAGRKLRFGLLARISVTLLALGAYTATVEDRPPILRALIMAALYLAAQLLYRRVDLLNVAGLGALSILLARPSELGNASFLLSFAAVGTIGALAVPLLDHSTEPYRRALRHVTDVTRDVSFAPRRIQFRLEMRAAMAWISARSPRFTNRFTPQLLPVALSGAFYFGDIVLISAVLQLGMLPLLTYYFHRVTLAGPFANIPAILLTGLAVPLGFLTLGVSFISHSAAVVCANGLGIVFELLNSTVAWFARWQGGSYRMPEPSAVLIGAFALFAGLVAVAIRLRWKTPVLASVTCGLLATAALIATHPFAPRLARGALEFTALDVGQGDSLFLAFPHGRTMLVDAGGAIGTFHAGGMRSGIDIGEDVVSPYLWSRGIKRLDVVALTHAHEDHLGGMPAILENFRVGELWVGRNVQSAAYWRLLQVARAHGVKVRHLKQEDRFDEDGVAGEVLWPEDLSEGESPKNDDSLVLRLTDGTQSLLLAGDIERASEHKILQGSEPVQTNFLKVAHHGSKTSTTEPFLSAAHPVFAAISVGRDNSFGHPSPEVVDRLQDAGVHLYRTDRDGAITAITNGKDLTVTTFLKH